MTIPQFFGCAMIAFGPPLAMFCLTVAHDPVRIIVMICAAFAWLVSFLAVSICWALLSSWGQYLAIGAVLSVLSQEVFRYLFHIVAMKSHTSLTEMMNQMEESSGNVNPTVVDGETVPNNQSGTRVTNHAQAPVNMYKKTSDRLALSYVSGLGYGVMSGAFAFVNVLVDSLGPATTGLHGDSQYFFLVSAMTTLAFILMNVSWSVLTAESIERSNRKLQVIVVLTHLMATAATFLNRVQYQIVSLVIVNTIMIGCGIASFEIARVGLAKTDRSR